MLFDVHYRSGGITLTTMLFDENVEEAGQQFRDRYPFLTLVRVIAVPTDRCWQNDPQHTMHP